MDVGINHPNYSLTKSKEEGYFEEDALNPLPRAVMRPNSFVLLDGQWDFALDPDNKGLNESWFIHHDYTDTAHWPGSVEAHMDKNDPNGIIWNDQVVVWYERSFPLPKTAGGIDPSLTELQLTFGACGYETMVWLNGSPLKTIEGESVHVGEYTSFSYELDELILQPTNRLTVRIAGNMDADTPRGKQESTVYKRGGIWYRTYTGGVRSIWLETVEKNRLRSRVGVVSSVEDNLVRFTFTTRIHDAGDYTIRLMVYNRKDESNELLASDEYPLKMEVGQKNQRLVIEIPQAKHWTHEHPHLYMLVARLIDSNGHISEIETHFGLRKIEARGNKIFLNNKAIYLNGILYQPNIATYQEIKQHMYAMKALGCNLIRIHIDGVDPRIYNLADKLGMLLWIEVPSPHRSTKKSRENHSAELMRMLALIGTHPSVVIWSLYNEDWGAQDIATNIETRQHITGIYHYMQLAHPQFLVVDNDGWQHISYEGRLKSDLMTAHLYTPDLEHWKTLLDKLVKGVQIDVTAFPLVVGDPFFYRRQVPLIVSEWGGFGFVNYGGPKDDSDRATQIAAFKKELRIRAIAGDVYTQATNIEDERNGLIDFSTAALQVPEGLLGSPEEEQF